MVYRHRWAAWRMGTLCIIAMTIMVLGCWLMQGTSELVSQVNDDFQQAVRPFLQRYCLECHSTKHKKGSLDLERFQTVAVVRQDIKRWQQILEMVEGGEMPPADKLQPSAKEKQTLLHWIKQTLKQEAQRRAGDPGFVPLRRLSNTEYDRTIFDLTGIDLHPANAFPADGAAGEGFTNAAEALTDISPTLLAKYLQAAKEIADHAVLVHDGFRFSVGKTRRDWTDENTRLLRQFYAQHAPPDGKLNLEPYLLATIRHREAVQTGRRTLQEVAQLEQLNAKYLTLLWHALQDRSDAMPLHEIRSRWQKATMADAPQFIAEIKAWQNLLWKTANVGNYLRPQGQDYVDSFTKQYPSDPLAVKEQTLRWTAKPAPGEREVILQLSVRDLIPTADQVRVIWHNPRFEAPDQAPLLLKDYAKYRAAYEVDYASLFLQTTRYLQAVAEQAANAKIEVGVLAKQHGLDAQLLQNWIDLLAMDPHGRGRLIPTVKLELLDEKITNAGGKPSIHGWRKKGQELPIVLSNASDKAEHIPGTIQAHHVVMHPTPSEFVAVVWQSPITGRVLITSQVVHAHPAGGNGVAWWIEHRRAGRAKMLAEGSIPRGGSASIPPLSLVVAKGDWLFLAVDAHERDHTFDTTDVAFTIKDESNPSQMWDLAPQLADRIQVGNPQADTIGNEGVWRFVKGPSRAGGSTAWLQIPPHSLLGRWRSAVLDASQKGRAEELARQLQACLTSPRASIKEGPDRVLYDGLVVPDSILFQGVNLVSLCQPLPQAARFGWQPDLFGGMVDDASVAVLANNHLELRLPAALLNQRAFVVEGRLESALSTRVVQLRMTDQKATNAQVWPLPNEVLANNEAAGYKQLVRGAEEFRRLFPLITCFPQVIPNDEVVSLKIFHREDEPLLRLFLDAEQATKLDALWKNQDFIGQQAIAENKFLPQFIGYTTQDAPKAVVAFFENRRALFQQRAEMLEQALAAAEPKQMESLLEFAARAWRRPLTAEERSELLRLYQSLRQQGVHHEEAFRGVLTRILVAPAFLFRVETAPPGPSPGEVDDWALATRLSYFLWSSLPDEELRRLAAAGQLRKPDVLLAQMQRMVQDGRTRALAIEFGTQWLHVRQFDTFNEKNEKLFPAFTAALRSAMYEEAIRFFLDFFQADRPVLHLLNADATFLNELLAQHYGIPGVAGPEWRRVEPIRPYGRGGVLGLGCVLAKQAGASRTSPILRGNWVVETLLGEKLPRPPANVPQLPEVEGADQLSMRQIVERHTRQPECATCHVRIDPFGFAFEKYDAVGKRRETNPNGTPILTLARLKDGTEFSDLSGLRDYLINQKQDVFVRLFCQKLLGYALGRATTLADQPIIDQMVLALKQKNGRMSAAMSVIVLSPPFRMIRGAASSD